MLPLARIHPRFLSFGFWGWAALWLLLAAWGFHLIGERFLLGIDAQKDTCLIGVGRIILIDTKDRHLWRGDLIAFRADERMAPYFQPGALMSKRLAGVPGDHVVVNADGVSINGVQVAKGLALSEKLKRPPSDFYVDEIIPPGHYFVVGNAERSFDSRYWGLVREDQVVGKSHALNQLSRAIELMLKWIAPAGAAEIDLQALKEIRDQTRAIQEKAESIASAPNNPLSGKIGDRPEKLDAALREARAWADRFQQPDLASISKALEAVSPHMSAQEAEQQAKAWIRALFEQPIQKEQKRRFLVLVSSSLGRERLRDLFSAYAGQMDVAFAFQGLLEGQKIEDFAALTHSWIEGIDPPPNIVLDPLIFKKYGVTHAPVLLALEGDRLLARIDGLVNVEWLKDRLASPQVRLPLVEQHGQVIAIAERNLMDVIEERLAAIDWKEKTRQAMERFWSRQEFVSLTPAPRDRTRLIDMRVVVPKDVLTPDGKLIAKAGETLNPLEKISFRQALIVFDAASQAEIDWAKRAIDEAARDGLMPVLIASRLPEGREWRAIEAIENDTGLPLYILPKVLKDRFEIEHTPSLITPHDAIYLQIREFRLCDGCS